MSKRLGSLLRLPVVHLDTLYWSPGWTEPDKAQWAEIVRKVICQNAWVLDGNYSGTLAERIEAADTVVFLDVSRLICLWRVLKRITTYRGKTRPDMPDGCPERFDIAFLLWIWNYPNRTRRKVWGCWRPTERQRTWCIFVHAEMSNDSSMGSEPPNKQLEPTVIRRASHGSVRPLNRGVRRQGDIMTVKRMDNVGIVLEDIDAAIEFFTELGLTLEGRMPIENEWAGRVTGVRGQRVEIAMMRTPDGHSRLELSRFDAPAIASDHRTAPVNSLGYLRVMFTVEDIDDTLARLSKLGATVVDEVVNYEDIYRLCYIRGPEGILIGLAQQLRQQISRENPMGRKPVEDSGVGV
jgi:adenylate kinase family enzyme